MSSDNIYRLAVHGLAVQLRCDVPAVTEALDHYIEPFIVPAFPQGFGAVSGAIRAYDQREVLKCLSPTARRLAATPDFLELYQEQERYWVIDERWGLCEINLLKGSWRSWLLPTAARDPVRAVHFAALWPMAQALRGKGLHLLPASAISRGGSSYLILSPFGIDRELTALVQAGWRVIGQSWTAVRHEGGRIELLHLPGYVERPVAPAGHAGLLPTRDRRSAQTPTWIDLMGEYCGAEQRYGFCNGVIIVEPGRRPTAAMSRIERGRAGVALRAAWPIAELHPHRRQGQLLSQIAQLCTCFEAELTRDCGEFVDAMARMASGKVTSSRRSAAVA